MSNAIILLVRCENEMKRLRRENYRLRLEIGRLMEENAKLRRLLKREDGF